MAQVSQGSNEFNHPKVKPLSLLTENVSNARDQRNKQLVMSQQFTQSRNIEGVEKQVTTLNEELDMATVESVLAVNGREGFEGVVISDPKRRRQDNEN